MKAKKYTKPILLGAVYGIHFLLALALWLCGKSGNIMLGILLIVLYRPNLWFTPLVVTAICWLPIKSDATLQKRVLFYLANIVICTFLFVLCRLLFGNWF